MRQLSPELAAIKQRIEEAAENSGLDILLTEIEPYRPRYMVEVGGFHTTEVGGIEAALRFAASFKPGFAVIRCNGRRP